MKEEASVKRKLSNLAAGKLAETKGGRRADWSQVIAVPGVVG